MTNIADTLQLVRFVIGPDGKPTDAILSIEVWEKLLDWLETLEDINIVKVGLARLKAVNGNPKMAGLISWQEAEAELGQINQVEAKTHI